MKKMILLIAMLTLVAFVSAAMAQPKPAEKPAAPAAAPAKEKPKAPAKEEKAAKLDRFSGAVDKVDEAAKTVAVKGKVKKEDKTMTFALDDKTKISKAGKDMPLAELKQGMNVTVEYKKDGDKMTAVSIKVAAPKAPAKKPEEKKPAEKPAEAPKK